MRLLLTPAATGDYNMALDEGLMERARRTGEWVFRVYGWSAPTLSLGRNQTARGGYDPAALAARRIAVVRRPTGGRAILHWREVTYSVTGPDGGAGSLRESYAWINRLLLAGLRELGVEAALASAPRAVAPGLAPCFDHPSSGELVHRGRKLVGSAQWRHDGALLQHGSILVEDDQSVVPSLLAAPAADGSTHPAPATLADALGSAPTLEGVAGALFAAVVADDPHSAPLDDPPELERLVAPLLPRYRDDAWTWRR